MAWTNLYGSTPNPIVATHNYVKFSPTTQDHLADLDEWETLNEVPLFDFPLEYEVITAGEYYIDPAVSDSLFTYQYASVPITINLPTSVPYTVIEGLYLDYSNPLLLAESFSITGNDGDIDNHFNGTDGIDPNNVNSPTGFDPPPPPDCPEGSTPTLFINENSTPTSYIWICMPDELDDGNGGNNNNTPNLNECGCPIPFNQSNPAGCVRVDRDGGIVPITSITVKTKDNWFTSDFATTDENGCWKVNHNYGGNMWMFVEFKNSACKIRDVGHWLGLRVLKDYVGKFNQPFNNNYLRV